MQLISHSLHESSNQASSVNYLNPDCNPDCIHWWIGTRFGTGNELPGLEVSRKRGYHYDIDSAINNSTIKPGLS